LFDIKLSIISAAAAFAVSFLIGLLSGTGFLFLLFRAVIFAIIFFILSGAAYWTISTFLPDLLSSESAPQEGDEFAPGSRVNLSVGEGDDTEIETSELYANTDGRFDSSQNDDDAAELEEFTQNNGYGAEGTENRIGMDQKAEAAYTGQSDESGKSSLTGAKPALPTMLSGDVDVLPDLESLSDSFISPITEVESEKGSVKTHSTAKAAVGGDTFDMKEMASAIQTILKRDQKG